MRLFSREYGEKRCIFIYEEFYEVSTPWGWFRLDEGAWRDYRAGKLWIGWVPGKPAAPAPAQEQDPLPPEVGAEALRLRDAAREDAFLLWQRRFPGARPCAPYKARMRTVPIGELALSVRSSNGLMRAGAADFGRLWEVMNREGGLRSVRNLGERSESEILRCFFNACYQLLRPGEQAAFWQQTLDESLESRGGEV